MHRRARARAFEPEPEPERNITMSKDLGNRIAEMLSKRGITQKELASTIGVTEAVISRYVSGERDPKPETIANIATALRTTSDISYLHIQSVKKLPSNL